ncbi:MAG: hypothetical protein MZU97_09165 [Bacillus subtilis]|nr:hypothetical protein [Bacillus subtilis]
MKLMQPASRGKAAFPENVAPASPYRFANFYYFLKLLFESGILSFVGN